MELALPFTTAKSAPLAAIKSSRNTPGNDTMSTAKSLRRMIDQVKLMRDAEEQFTPQMFQLLLEIALQPGITMQGLTERTGLALSSVSRNLMALGEWHRIGKAGLNFVETTEDPHERRRKIAFLTPKGRKFVEENLGALFPGQENNLNAPTAREFLTGLHRRG